MSLFCRTAAMALLCSVLVACGGGGGGGGNGGGNGGGGDGGVGGLVPPSHAFLPTDTSLRLTYTNQQSPAQFESTTQRNSQYVAPFVYPTGGKEYYVSTSESVSFAGFYSPQVAVGGAGTFTADARFDTPVVLFRNDSQAGQTASVSGAGTVTISPTYGSQALTYAGTVRYVGPETITNSVGTFSTKRVSLQLTASTTIQGSTFTVPFFVDLWFARDLGIVRRVESGQALQLVQASGPDGDGDGTFNGLDAFPNDSTETRDSDADGRGDNADSDDDNDGVIDGSDRFPLDSRESVDTDNDGVGNNADPDDDNDTVWDSQDPFPLDIHNVDTDRDGTADFYDGDDDNDGVADSDDRFPLDGTETRDTDGDGIGNNRDTDDDSDNHPDDDDAYPTDPQRWELLNAGQSSISLTAVFGGATNPGANIQVIGDGISWQAQSSASWLQLDRQSGNGDGNVFATANVQGLAVGTHHATVTFSDSDTPRSVTVNVQLTITLPVLSVTSAELQFDGKFGWSNLTRPIDVSLSAGPSYPITITTSFDVPNAVTTSYSGNVVGYSPQRLNVTLDPAQLRSGRYTGQITLTADVNGRQITSTISLEALASERVLYPSNDGVALLRVARPPVPTGRVTRTITVRDSYGVSGTAWTATGNQPWLQITPSGVSGGELTITADPTGLAEGLYRGVVTLSSDDDNVQSTKPINVSLWVQDQTNNMGGSVAATYTQLVSDPLRPYVYAHNGSGSIDVFHMHTRTQLPSITSVGGVLGPMATSTDGKWLFVLNPVNGSVTRVDLDNPSVTITWPLTDRKPPFGEPTALVYARPNGHPVLMLSDRRVVDADTGAVFPVGQLNTLPNFDVMRSSVIGDRICVLTTRVSPFSGGCFAMYFSDYDTLDVSIGTFVEISGFNVPGAGAATDLAVTADSAYAIVGIASNPQTLVRFGVLGGYLGPVYPESPTHVRRATRGLAAATNGVIYADIIGEHGERIYSFDPDGTQGGGIGFDDTSITGLHRQLVVTGDGFSIAYLTGSAPPLPTVSTRLHFLHTY